MKEFGSVERCSHKEIMIVGRYEQESHKRTNNALLSVRGLWQGARLVKGCRLSVTNPPESARLQSQSMGQTIADTTGSQLALAASAIVLRYGICTLKGQRLPRAHRGRLFDSFKVIRGRSCTLREALDNGSLNKAN